MTNMPMTWASRFKRMEGAGIPMWLRDACSLALSQPFPIFPPRVTLSEERGGSAGLCATSTALAVHAHGPGAPQLPCPCPGSLGPRSLEMSLPRAHSLWALHPHQALPSASKGCCTLAGGCPGMQFPLSWRPPPQSVSWMPVSSHTESFSLGPLGCFHCHGQWQAPSSESCIKSQVNTSPCLFPLGKINK